MVMWLKSRKGPQNPTDSDLDSDVDFSQFYLLHLPHTISTKLDITHPWAKRNKLFEPGPYSRETTYEIAN